MPPKQEMHKISRMRAEGLLLLLSCSTATGLNPLQASARNLFESLTQNLAPPAPTSVANVDHSEIQRRIDAFGTTLREKAAAATAVKRKLRELDLEQYAPALVNELGYNTIESMEGLSPEAVKAIADRIHVKPGHMQRFLGAFPEDAYTGIVMIARARTLRTNTAKLPIAAPPLDQDTNPLGLSTSASGAAAERDATAREYTQRYRESVRQYVWMASEIDWLSEQGEPRAAELLEMRNNAHRERFFDMLEEILSWAGEQEALFKFKDERADLPLGTSAALERSWQRDHGNAPA